ncbi:hypothetical protein ABBQ32_013042 [Trebouxia sp. C0010 RCD-2024]
MHVHEAVAGKSPSGKVIVDIDKYEPIARLGGNFYGRIKEVFELSRPNSEQMRHRVEQLHTQASKEASKEGALPSTDSIALSRQDDNKEVSPVTRNSNGTA